MKFSLSPRTGTGTLHPNISGRVHTTITLRRIVTVGVILLAMAIPSAASDVGSPTIDAGASTKGSFTMSKSNLRSSSVAVVNSDQITEKTDQPANPNPTHADTNPTYAIAPDADTLSSGMSSAVVSYAADPTHGIIGQPLVPSSPDLRSTSRKLDGSSVCYTGDGATVTADCGGACCDRPNACVFTSATVCEGSCIGDNSCERLADGVTISENSCIGLGACKQNEVSIPTGSCTGRRACQNNKGAIASMSCTNQGACLGNTGSIGEGSCTGTKSCQQNSGDIGAGSCLKLASCRKNSGPVSDGSCLLTRSCDGNSGNIGPGFCVEAELCQGNTKDIPTWMQIGSDIEGEVVNDFFGRALAISADGTIVAVGATNNGGTLPDTGDVRIFRVDSGSWEQMGDDIEGEGTEDSYGFALSISADGLTVAIGGPNNDGNGDNAGHVRVFDWNSTAWVQRGDDIEGEAPVDLGGRSVSISADGDILAIGARLNDGTANNAGHVRVYEWNSTAWVQRGDDIDGEAAGDESGYSSSLSPDGLVVAIGAIGNDGNGSNSGHVRVFEWNSTAWVQRGDDIDGEAEGDRSGFFVSLSYDGSILAVGARNNDGNGNDAGHVRVHEWNSTAWVQRGDDIDGEAEDDESGYSVSLSYDGSILAVGARDNDGFANDAGHVRVYKWNSLAWNQIGNDIDGKAEEEGVGRAVDLSADGSILAVGAPEDDGDVGNAGRVRVYKLI